MKKLSVILSVILCLSMMTMGVSAETSKEILTGDDAFAIYEKCANKMSKLQYLEIRGFMKATQPESASNETKMTREVADYKFAVTPDGIVQAEGEIWDASGERTGHIFIKDGYVYDRMNQTKYRIGNYSMREQIYTIIGADSYSYKDDIKNIKAEKVENGYRVWYTTSYFSIYDNDRYTLMINDDFTLESVTNNYSYGSPYFGMDSYAYRYEILSMNRPLKINFPADLSRYDLTY